MLVKGVSVSVVRDFDWSVRPATAADAATLCDIVIDATKDQGLWPIMTAAEERAWREDFTSWSVDLASTVNTDGTLWVIEAEGQSIGRLRAVRGARRDPELEQTRRIELAGIQLRPAWQGRGIGTAIIRGLQGEARREGIPLDIGVGKDNPQARRLYDRLGFVCVGEDDKEHFLRWTATER